MLIPLAGLDPAGVLTTTLRVDPGAIPEESLHCSVFWSIQITLEQRPVVTVVLGKKPVPVIVSTDPPTDGHPLLCLLPPAAPGTVVNVQAFTPGMSW
jgi:hypothetical protein